jgi:hypothetical protein
MITDTIMLLALVTLDGSPLLIRNITPPTIIRRTAATGASLNIAKSIILSSNTKKSQNLHGQQVVPQTINPSVGQQFLFLSPTPQVKPVAEEPLVWVHVCVANVEEIGTKTEQRIIPIMIANNIFFMLWIYFNISQNL